jgi:hypothetical protein
MEVLFALFFLFALSFPDIKIVSHPDRIGNGRGPWLNRAFSQCPVNARFPLQPLYKFGRL